MVMQKILLLEVKRESCIMSKARKEFTFDLDTKKLKDIFGEKSYTKGRFYIMKNTTAEII